MLEVCARFPKIGTIADYQALPAAEKSLYNHYALMKIEAESRAVVPKVEIQKKGG